MSWHRTLPFQLAAEKLIFGDQFVNPLLEPLQLRFWIDTIGRESRVQPRIYLVGEGKYYASDSTVGTSYRKIQCAFPPLHRAHSLTDISCNFFP